MILRRFAEALKQQNWTSICIEFVLLVAGVFLGIQVANWNESRLERAVERQSLLLLLKEVEQNAAYAQYVIDNAEARLRDAAAVVAMLQQKPPGTGDANSGVVSLATYRASTPISVIFDALRSSGKLATIQSDALRVRLSVYESLILYNERLRANYADRAPDIASMISPHATFTFDPARPTGYDIDVDWEAASKDRLLVNAAVRALGDQSTFHQRRFLFKDEALRLCRALARELGRTCVPKMD
jgi:hypothetical protein